MKRVLLLLTVAMFAGMSQASAQNEGARDLKLMVRNRKGKVIRGLNLVAQLKGSNEVLSIDRSGDGFFRINDADTLLLVAPDNIYEFPLEGLDSLYVVFRNSSKIMGYRPRGGGFSEMINIGYGTTSRLDNTGAVSTLDMEGADTYTDLKNYIRGRVPGLTVTEDDMLIIRGIATINGSPDALVVVDGVKMNFAAANSAINPKDVADISVLRDASSTAIYGVVGGNGVVLITTRRGRDQ